MTESWKKDTDGNIIMCPLHAFELLIASAPAPRVSMYLRYLQKEDLPNEPTGVTQLVFDPAQAQQLARALATAARQALGEIDLGRLNNLS